MKFHPGRETIFPVSKKGMLKKDRFLQAIQARKEIVFEGQKPILSRFRRSDKHQKETMDTHFCRCFLHT